MKKKSSLKVSKDGDVAYLHLLTVSDTKEKKKIIRQIRLRDLLPDYIGADIYLDFNTDNVLAGIEILEWCEANF